MKATSTTGFASYDFEIQIKEHASVKKPWLNYIALNRYGLGHMSNLVTVIMFKASGECCIFVGQSMATYSLRSPVVAT